MSMVDNIAKDAVKHVIDELGVNIVYTNYTSAGKDAYGQPVYTQKIYSLKGTVESLSLRDAKFVEAGYLPEHYLYFYFYPDDVTFTINKAKDEISYNGDIYIIRNIFYYKINDTVVYVKLLCRRKEVKTVA